uniref:Uncharacterized protein n=1 Tax=Arundo donax TaxID=35708 RepID=A0A0A8Y8E1_ARUDO
MEGCGVHQCGFSH